MFTDHRTTSDASREGISRRRMLRIGGSGLLAGLSLPRLLEFEAVASTDQAAKAQACIFLFLEGGPSSIDMWDMKPEAPIEIRGPFKPIATSVPGTFVSEHLPHSAAIAHKYTILRSHSHADNGHNTGYHYLMTGYKADFADGEGRTPNNVLYPSAGSIISRELGRRGSLPPYVNLPHPMQAGGPGFFGSQYAPFIIESDPSQPDFEVKDLRLVDGVGAERLSRRRKLLDEFEQRPGQPAAAGRAAAMSTYYEKAHSLITSREARKAFDIHSEPEEIRATYGYTALGQCALLARRLVQSGCRFVGIDHSGWDSHFTIFPSLETDLLPHADRAFAALVNDLERHGLLDSTLVVMMGEMGRTPRVNAAAGRDHWSMCQSVVFAGGGVKPGQVLGASDKQAAYPTTEPLGVQDILRTIFQQMGIDSTKTYYTPLGRPVPIVSGGKIIPGLV
jgi:hypothetical protein